MATKKRSKQRRATPAKPAKGAKPNLKAFVIMPFRPVENVVYARVIVPLAEEIGYDVARADTTLNQRAIMQDVIEGIQGADLVVADLSGRNANVFYELGLAHALRRPVVLLAQASSDIPFDLGAYRAVLYNVDLAVQGGEVRTEETLSVELRSVLTAARNGDIAFSSPFLDYGALQTATEEDPQEPGILDQMAEFIAAVPEYQRAMERIGAMTTSMGGGMRTLTEEMQNSPAGANPVEFALIMVGRAAALWNRYADELEPVVNEQLLPIADRVERSATAEARAAILAGDRDRYNRALEQAETLSATSAETRETIGNFAEIIRNTAQWGSAMRTPANRLGSMLERIAAHFDRVAGLPSNIKALRGAEDWNERLRPR